MSTNARDRVTKALKDLCAERPSPGEILFRIHFTAEQVAQRAGVSTTTARKYLNRVCGFYLGCQRQRINGTYGYRYDEPYP